VTRSVIPDLIGDLYGSMSDFRLDSHFRGNDKNTMNTFIIGSLAYDYIMDFPGRFADRIMEDKIHSLSLSFLVDNLKKQFGGTGLNIAYTLKLLGIDPYVLACAGNDFTPYKSFLKKHRISTQYIKEYKDRASSSYFCITDMDNNQIGSFYVGAMKHAGKLSLHTVTQPVQFVMIAPTDPGAMVKTVTECRMLNVPYMYDPAFQIATFTKEQLTEGITGAKILIANDYEMTLLEEKTESSHEEIVAKVPIIITTLGAKGSIIETRHESIHIKPANVKNIVDPTGAGDAYRGGFLAGYLRGFSLDICGRMGSVAAAYTVELFGTQTHRYTKREFITRFDSNFPGDIKL
jgi:adenosine kinase